ncbi:solute carrier organic anion transporter family member 6A1-like [Grammomys surdaster]|uniref:solute carrier organic anion transporter family member 6A1-like n=1 Tax=Grammomys surdaster TaxID=491861 RepID=UPI0010A04963|nr:solute carrier organic anion transporter family member 6A1-like [Grammomys surdaster]
MDQNPKQSNDSIVKAPVEIFVEPPVDSTAEEAPVDIMAEALVGEWNDSEQESLKVVPYQKPRLSTAMLDITTLQNTVSEESSQLSDTMPDASLEGSFGLGPLVFSSLQRFNNINFFLISFCILSLAQGIIFGLSDVSTGNFEKDFYLSRAEKVILTIAYDLASLSVAILVAHYGCRGNRSKWVAAAAFLVGLGSITLAVPYLKYEIVRPVEDTEELCMDEEQRTMPNCEKNVVPFKSEIIYLSIIGQFLQGIAGMPMYILGVTYIYDNVSIYTAGIYLGIADATQILGYGLGYVVGSPNLRPSFNHSSEEPINDNFLLWQFNWFVGFLGATLLAWFTFFPFLCFPHSLPGAHKLKLPKEKDPLYFYKKLKDMKYGSHFQDLFHALSCLLRNPLLMCYSMCKATESLASIGASEFLPKYLENQFLLTPSRATLLTGIILVPAAAIGNFLGGFIVSKLKLSCKSQMKFIMVTSVISLLLLTLNVFVKCERVKFAGINEDYEGSGSLGNLTAPCNAHCGCESSIYSSVCGRDETEYFSPCFAGCLASKTLHYEKTFYNCSCIKHGLANEDSETERIDATYGKCNTNCYALPLFFAFFFSSIAFSSAATIPITLIILRTLPSSLHSLGIAVTFTTLRLFGSIPGPLLFQVTASSSCTYWDINKCGIKGRCWIYNKLKMMSILMGLCIFCKLATTLLTLLALYKYNVIRVGSENVKKKKGTKRRK